jgi:outer membrane lipoprotein-sorting protein
MNSPPPDDPARNRSRFYVTGGALSLADACYVPRSADHELLESLQAGDFCYVLTSRQRGKSSLMIRIAHKLRESGTSVVLLDLTRIGQNVTVEQWYLGLLDLLIESLQLETELESYWNNHKETGPMQRWFNTLTRAALPLTPKSLVVFLDEIDAVSSLPFATDEFFAAIRECYNRRTQDASLHKLSFCLLGVASAADLIRDGRSTPFNIGRRIVLTDFTEDEARRLGSGLNPDVRVQRNLIQRVIYWTNGHPYLTQRLCAAIAQNASTSASNVDRICKDLFLSSDARKREDNLLFVAQQLLRSNLDRVALLELYRRIRRGRTVRNSDADPLIEALRLSGIARVDNGKLVVRNRIYQSVFDEDWIDQNLPESELLRQRDAFRKGLRGGLVLAPLLIMTAICLVAWANYHHRSYQCERLGSAYDEIQTYKDSSSIKINCDPLSLGIDTQFAFARPNKFRLESSLKIIFGEFKVEGFCDGRHLWIYAPALKQYIEEPAPENLYSYVDHNATIEPMFEVFRQTLRAYGVLFSTNGAATIHARAWGLRLAGNDEMDGQPCRRFVWLEKCKLHVPQGYGVFLDRDMGFPSTVWARNSDGMLVKSTTDMSALRSAIVDDKVQILKFSGSNFVATVEHSNIQINSDLDASTFSFTPPGDAALVVRLDFSKVFPMFLTPTKPLFPPNTGH